MKMLPAHSSPSDFTVSRVEIESRKLKCKAAEGSSGRSGCSPGSPRPLPHQERQAGPSDPTQGWDRSPGPTAFPWSLGLSATAGGSQGWGEAALQVGRQGGLPASADPTELMLPLPAARLRRCHGKQLSPGTNNHVQTTGIPSGTWTCLVGPTRNGEALQRPATAAPPPTLIRKLRPRQGKGLFHEPPGTQGRAKEALGHRAGWGGDPMGKPCGSATRQP